MLSQKRNHYYWQQKELRIQQAIDTMVIDTIGDATFAVIPSTSGFEDVYIVDIDESGNVPLVGKCTCPGYAKYGCNGCIHILAVNRFYERIQALLHPVITEDEVGVYSASEVMADADTQVRINEQQAVRDAASNPYDVLAEQKYIARVETRDDGLTTVYGTNGCTTIGGDRDEAVKLHIHYAWWATELKRRDEEWQRYQNYELGIQGLGA